MSSPAEGDAKMDIPRKTPKRRSLLIEKNADIIEKYRKSMGTAEAVPPLTGLDEAAHEGAVERIAVLENELAAEKAMRAEAQALLLERTAQVEEEQARMRALELEAKGMRETKLDRRLVAKLRKTLSQQERLVELLCAHVDASTVMEFIGEATLSIQQDLTSSRHSLDVMATLEEVEIEEESRRRSGDGANSPTAELEEGAEASTPAKFALLVKARKELDDARREAEALRKTADKCWVDTQTQRRRVTELEEENAQLSAYIEQMDAAHLRLVAAVKELKNKNDVMERGECVAELQAELAERNARLAALAEEHAEQLAAARLAELEAAEAGAARLADAEAAREELAALLAAGTAQTALNETAVAVERRGEGGLFSLGAILAFLALLAAWLYR